jgi:hypothetical protein
VVSFVDQQILHEAFAELSRLRGAGARLALAQLIARYGIASGSKGQACR